MSGTPEEQLQRLAAGDRLHHAHLLSGPGPRPPEAALAFVRAIVCSGGPPRPCEACGDCRRSAEAEPIAIDGTGRSGPLLRHVGDHPELLWVERGERDTRVRITQIRALQHQLRLRSAPGARRAAVIADAEWLNLEAQNALLRLLEEPPPDTTLVLVATSSAGLLTTVRSRCQRIVFPREVGDRLAEPEHAERAERLDELGGAGLPALLDWAAEFRGARAPAALGVHELLETGSAWLRRRVRQGVENGGDVQPALAADRVLQDCRKGLDQRNANPQMVAERALLALREATG